MSIADRLIDIFAALVGVPLGAISCAVEYLRMLASKP